MQTFLARSIWIHIAAAFADQQKTSRLESRTGALRIAQHVNQTQLPLVADLLPNSIEQPTAVFKAISNGWNRLNGMRAIRLRKHSANAMSTPLDTKVDCDQYSRLCAPDVCKIWLPEVQDKCDFGPKHQDRKKVLHVIIFFSSCRFRTKTELYCASECMKSIYSCELRHSMQKLYREICLCSVSAPVEQSTSILTQSALFSPTGVNTCDETLHVALWTPTSIILKYNTAAGCQQ